MKDAQAQADAQNAANQAAAQAAQAQAQALQQQLDLANQFMAVIDKAGQMLKDMQLSSSNPMSALGRLAMSQDDVAKARAAFTGEGGGTAANAQALIDALTTERGLAQSTLQRSSDEYQAVYNQIVNDLGLVAGKAPDVQKQTLDLTQSIANLQAQANAYASQPANATPTPSSPITAPHPEAPGSHTYPPA